MVVDAVRTYLDAANGFTELSRKEAVAAAKTLLRAGGQASSGAAAEGEDPPRVGQSIQVLAGELIETSRTNREAIADLVRGEVTRQLESMDVVSRGEYERLTRRVAELERRLAARHAVERALAPRSSGEASPVSPADNVDNADNGDGGAQEAAREAEAAPAEQKTPARTKAKNTRSKSSGKRTTKPAAKNKDTTKK